MTTINTTSSAASGYEPPGFGDIRFTIKDASNVDITNRLWHKQTTIKLSQDGYSADVFLDYSDGATVPAVGDKLTVSIPTKDGQHNLVLIPRTVAKIQESYPNNIVEDTIWISHFYCVDPLTYLFGHALPTRLPYIGTTTGAIFRDLIGSMDPSLNVSGIQDGNSVSSLNLFEFANFGDVVKSEIVANGYVLRMNYGLNVDGRFDTAFGNQDYAADKNDYRYTPSHMNIEPPQELIDSVTVLPGGNTEIPYYGSSEYFEIDGRGTDSFPLTAKPMDMNNTEVLSLAGGLDFSDPNQFQTTGSITSSGNFLIFNTGTLITLDARPIVSPYSSNWIGIRATGPSAAFRSGFQDSAGGWLFFIDASDFGGFIEDTEFHQHVYGGYTVGHSDGSVTLWGLHLDQNFEADVTNQIATITAIDGPDIAIELNSPWNVGSDFIRVVAPDHATERGRAVITQRSQDGKKLFLDNFPPGVTVGDGVYLGVSAIQTITVFPIRTVTPSNQYGLPAITGTDVAIENFLIQRTGQITGQILSESNPNPNSTYPRDMVINTVVTDNTDCVITANGSSAQVTLDTNFGSHVRDELIFNYIVGTKSLRFNSVCGSANGQHINVVIDNEGDPAVLQAIADRICFLGHQAFPRITVPIESCEVKGIPLPWDFMPVNLPAQYKLANTPIPLMKNDIHYKGADDSSDPKTDIVMFNLEAGTKTATERAKEELLRDIGITKYPIRFATIPGVKITSVSWDDHILKATLSSGTLLGPHGETLDLAGGVSPASVMGESHPARAPVTLRGTVNTGRSHPDIVTFTVVYPPDAIDPTTVKTALIPKTNRGLWSWINPDGALKQNIYRRISPTGGDASGNLQLVDTVVAPGSSTIQPVNPIDKTIWLQSEGLCDKRSSLLKLDLNPPKLPAPFMEVLKNMNHRGRFVLNIGPPPTGDSGTINDTPAVKLRIFVSKFASGFSPTGTGDYDISDNNVQITDYPVAWKDSTPKAFHLRYDLYQPGDSVFATCAWLDLLDDVGFAPTPIDVVHPPFSIGSISTASFFRSPDPNSPGTNQAAGGVYLDDDDTTTKIETTGIFRYLNGVHNDWIKIRFERSSKAGSGDNDFEWSASGHHEVKSPRIEITNDNLVSGFVDFEMFRDFIFSKKKHFAYRPSLITVGSNFTREKTDPDGHVNLVRAKRFLVGVEDAPSGHTVIPYDSDGFFNKNDFIFKPWLIGIAHTFPNVTGVALKAKQALLKLKFDAIDDSALRRYIAIISESSFGDKGPGSDASLASDLDTIMATDGGVGNITMYDPGNSSRSVACVAVDIGNVPKYHFLTGDVYGSITITSGTTYFVRVLGQNKAGRYSVGLSNEDSDAGSDFSGGGGTTGTIASRFNVSDSIAMSRLRIVGDIVYASYAPSVNHAKVASFDISALPTITGPVGTVQPITTGSDAGDFAINDAGTHVFASADTHTIHIYSISAGVFTSVGTYNAAPDFTGFSSGGLGQFESKGSLLIVQGNGGSGTRYVIYDISTPASPSNLGHFDFASSSVDFCIISTSLLAVYDLGADKTKLYDISTPSTPTVVATINVGGPALYGASGTNLYINDTATAIVYFYDVSVPSSPTLISSLQATDNLGNMGDLGLGTMLAVGTNLYIPSLPNLEKMTGSGTLTLAGTCTMDASAITGCVVQKDTFLLVPDANTNDIDVITGLV